VNVSSQLTVDSKGVYPGVSSHGAVCCSFVLPPSFSYVKNEGMKHLQFRKVSPLQLSLLSSHTSLFLWLHASALGMDTCFRLL
jgi:hypothetical protein